MQFPSNFRFGVADADLQVIGEKHTLENEQSEPTMWTHFAEHSGRVANNDTPLPGIDRYHQWKEDIQFIKDLSVKDYRTSISMSRTITREGKVNDKAIQWYISYFKELKEQGITIYATLYHWELPQFLSEQGGWTNKKSIEHFLTHVKTVYKYLNEYIEEYFILNEPWCSTFFSYHTADHAPGRKNLKETLEAAHNILLAQGLAYRELRALDKDIKISTVYNPVSAYALTPSKENLKARNFSWGYYTGWLMDPLYIGRYPEHMLEIFGDYMPKIENGDMESIRVGDKLHAFGINYYYSSLTQYDPKQDVKFSEVTLPGSALNGLNWPTFIPPIYGNGFYDTITQLYDRYQLFGMKRIYITENGTAWNSSINSDGSVRDDFRIFYLYNHIKQVYNAIGAGVPIESFFAWTLMDNYEWQFGYTPESCFGLIHVDRKTMKRTPKSSYYWYKELVKTKILNDTQ